MGEGGRPRREGWAWGESGQGTGSRPPMGGCRCCHLGGGGSQVLSNFGAPTEAPASGTRMERRPGALARRGQGGRGLSQKTNGWARTPRRQRHSPSSSIWTICASSRLSAASLAAFASAEAIAGVARTVQTVAAARVPFQVRTVAEVAAQVHAVGSFLATCRLRRT